VCREDDLNCQQGGVEHQEDGRFLGYKVPLVVLEGSHLNIQSDHGRLGCPDPNQGAQVVEAPRSPDIKVVQDGWIFELDLLDVVVEIQRHPRLHRSSLKKLRLENLNGLARPRAHRGGICVTHIWPDYSRIPGQPLCRLQGSSMAEMSHSERRRNETVFTELMPLLKQRVVMITISDVGEGLLRVNVIPRKLEGSADENGALTTPLSITGKADELDRELPSQLTSFTESVTKTGSNLNELKTQHVAAVKAVEAENKKKIEDRKKGNGSKAATTPPPAPAPTAEFKDGKPVFGSKASPAPVENGSLFENPTSTCAAATEAAEEASIAPQPQ
jgi:PRTRC genetic system protein E